MNRGVMFLSSSNGSAQLQVLFLALILYFLLDKTATRLMSITAIR